MATVVKKMIDTGHWNVQLIPEKPGYFRVTPSLSSSPSPPPQAAGTGTGMGWKAILAGAALCSLVSFAFAVMVSFLIQTAFWKAYVTEAVDLQSCERFPCFFCDIRYAPLFNKIDDFERACIQCCLKN